MKKIICLILGHKKVWNAFLGEEEVDWDWICKRCYYEHPTSENIMARSIFADLEKKMFTKGYNKLINTRAYFVIKKKWTR